MTNRRLSELSTDFDWEAIESGVNPSDVAVAIVSEVVAFIFAYVFAGTTTTETAFRRFVALAYIVRPDLVDHRSQQEIAYELKVTKSEIARHIAAVRDELAVTGPFLYPVASRLAIRAGQLRARRRKLRKPIRYKRQAP